MHDVLPQIILAAAVADAGTFTASYPSGADEGRYAYNKGHKLVVDGAELAYPADFTLTFGTSNITVTNASGAEWPAGARVYLQLDKSGDPMSKSASERVQDMAPIMIDLGAPDTADADGVCASQAITAAGGGTINGALASGGVATFDVPRNVVAAWTGTSVMTVTGTDEFGNTVVESSASGTSMAGKKAFKTITDVAVSADVTGATVGTGDVLGLPVFLRSIKQVIAEIEDNAAATAGTLVDGDILEPTATTGDVRGTYDPNSACDGAIVFSLLALVPNPGDKGLAQYAG